MLRCCGVVVLWCCGVAVCGTLVRGCLCEYENGDRDGDRDGDGEVGLS